MTNSMDGYHNPSTKTCRHVTLSSASSNRVNFPGEHCCLLVQPVQEDHVGAGRVARAWVQSPILSHAPVGGAQHRGIDLVFSSSYRSVSSLIRTTYSDYNTPTGLCIKEKRRNTVQHVEGYFSVIDIFCLSNDLTWCRSFPPLHPVPRWTHHSRVKIDFT